MKKVIGFAILLLLAATFNGCKKTNTSPSLPPGECRLVKESTTLTGNQAFYVYNYDTEGKVISIKKYKQTNYPVLQDSIVIGDKSEVGYAISDWPYGSSTIDYDNSFELLPSKAFVAQTESGITRTDVFTYFFFYDSKGRIYKVGEQTDLVIGDWEYDLNIFYDANDNVSGLQYEWTTGPNTLTNISATGYDNHPTPFAGIKNWPYIMHAAWNNYDPEPLLTALSKNNPLGYTTPDGFKREMTYTYNSNGYPIKRSNTNIAAPGGAASSSAVYTFDEIFEYDCQ